MKFSLVDFSLKRPITVTMLSLCMLTLGVIAWTRIPLQFLPEVSPPFINCRIPYIGASPEQVEEEVTIPAEGEFRTIPGLRGIRTISDSNGVFIHMRFDLDTDMTQATAEVRDRMERLKLILPDDVDRMLIERFSSRSIPIVALAVLSRGDEAELVHRVRTILEPRLRRIDGVADVVIYTTRPEEEIVIEFDQNTLRSMNLGLYDLVAALRVSSFNLSIGELVDADTKYFVRTVGEYRNLEDIRSLVVTPNGVRLGDIARVRYMTREPIREATIDRKGGAFVLAIKESEANTVATCRAVREVIDELPQDPQFAGVETKVFFDQSELILTALRNLRDSGIYGGIMAIIVLYLFLFRVRPTLIVALSIPTSLVVAIVVMFFIGMTLNIVSMVSMIIAIGMLVDNSIVVVENIIRHQRLGYSIIESAKRGAGDVGLAIAASTITTLVVFIPMFFMEAGRMSVFMKELALPLVVSLTGSLLIALTVVPLAMTQIREWRLPLFKRLGAFRKRRQGVVGGLLRFSLIDAVIRGYDRIISLALARRFATLLVLAAVLFLTYKFPYAGMDMQELPRLDTREVDIRVEFDQNFDANMAAEVFNFLENELDRRRDILGIKNIFKFFNASGGKLEIYLFTDEDGPEWESPQYSTEDVMDILSKQLPRLMPGVELTFDVADAERGDSEEVVAVQFRGDNAARLKQFADMFRVYMSRITGVKDAKTDVEKDTQEMQLRIDEDIAERAGISPLVVAQTVDAALRGARMPYMKQGGREIPVWAQFQEENRKNRDNLDNIIVIGAGRQPMPVNQLVDYTRAPTPASIHRYNGKNTVMVSATATYERLNRVKYELMRLAQMFDLPTGYSIELGEQLQELESNWFSFVSSLFMAIILVYLVMASLFESYMLPLSILTTVPLSFIGVLWLFFITSTPFDIVTLIGCILMVGLIVNNGIVIVDHVNQLRLQGRQRNEAILQAGRDRFRPVMMTAITTILGCVPLALTTSGGGVTFQGLGRAVVGGMSVGTVLTLIIVPLFYSMLDDLTGWVRAFFAGFSRRTRTEIS